MNLQKVIKTITPSSPPGGHRVHGPVLAPGAGVRRGAAGEDHGRLPGPVPVVRGGQAPPAAALGQAGRHRALAAARLQVVPG